MRSGTDDAWEAFELLEMASELFSEQPYQEQAKAIKILVSNCVLKAENGGPNYRRPFDLVTEGVRTTNWYPSVDNFGTSPWPKAEEIQSLLIAAAAV